MCHRAVALLYSFAELPRLVLVQRHVKRVRAVHQFGELHLKRHTRDVCGKVLVGFRQSTKICDLSATVQTVEPINKPRDSLQLLLRLYLGQLCDVLRYAA